MWANKNTSYSFELITIIHQKLQRKSVACYIIVVSAVFKVFWMFFLQFPPLLLERMRLPASSLCVLHKYPEAVPQRRAMSKWSGQNREPSTYLPNIEKRLLRLCCDYELVAQNGERVCRRRGPFECGQGGSRQRVPRAEVPHLPRRVPGEQNLGVGNIRCGGGGFHVEKKVKRSSSL